MAISPFQFPMSQSHIQKPTQPPPPVVWWHIALGSAVFLVLFATLFVIVNWVHTVPSTYETANGTILEIRNTVDGTLDTKSGGKIFYGAEAHVQYLLNGRLQDRWMRASDDVPRDILMLKLAAHPTKCLVYWPPNQPENAKCSLK